MKILYTAAEAAPFAKVGGLADVAGSLPKALKKLNGNDVRVIIPAYGSINFEANHVENVPNASMIIKLGDKDVPVSLKKTVLPNSDVIVYLVDNDEYFRSHKEVYPSAKDARFEQERFLVFSKAVLELMKKIDFKPDVINCNDWHTASIPVFLKTIYKDCDFYKYTATVFTIHNLAYQGLYSPDILEFAGLDKDEVFVSDKLEHNNDVNWMKGGIIYSDEITTVSEKYSAEIQTPEFGEGLEELLKSQNNKLYGILNGLDYTQWNPQTDNIISENFSTMNLRGKVGCKKSLQKQYGLAQKIATVPLIGIISRLVDQKGFDLIAQIADELKTLNIQIVVLGQGQEKYEQLFENLNDNSENIRATIGFDANMAKRIYAGCDMFLMPSKFEPCGLGQMIALNFGTVPIVRATGGLSDTIIDLKDSVSHANGFVFEDYSAEELLDTIKRAAALFNNKSEWTRIIKNAMSSNFSWEKSANRYLLVYGKAVEQARK